MTATESAKPSDSLVFAADELERAITDLIPKLPAPAKWPAFNAIRHINRAWKLKGIDNEMATFRAITAEEEAATALFLSLKRHRYDGADLLRERKHLHKNAVVPFLAAIGRVLAKFADQMPETQFYLDPKEDQPQVVLRFRHAHPTTGEPCWAYPQPPLNFLMSQIRGDERKKEDFAQGVEELASEANVTDILKYLDSRANMRNRILYAAQQGYPGIEGDIEAGLKFYQRNVFTILKAYLMIDPHDDAQLFVQQALTAFLRTLRAFPKKIEESSGSVS